MNGVTIPQVSPQWAGLTIKAENTRRSLADKFDVLRDNCRAKADNRSDTTWSFFMSQMIVFAGGIVLLSEALAFQSYR